MILPHLPLTWRWLGEGKAPANFLRRDAHPQSARWAVSFNTNSDGEYALLIEQPRPYGPTWHSLSEALRAGWIEAA